MDDALRWKMGDDGDDDDGVTLSSLDEYWESLLSCEKESFFLTGIGNDDVEEVGDTKGENGGDDNGENDDDEIDSLEIVEEDSVTARSSSMVTTDLVSSF